MGRVLPSRNRELEAKDLGNPEGKSFIQRKETMNTHDWYGLALMIIVIVLYYFNDGLAFAMLAGMVFSRW